MKKILLLSAFLTSSWCFSQTLDNTFGTNGGIVVSQFSTSKTDDYSWGAVLQSDGKIVHIGKSTGSSTTSFVARTNVSGDLDTSFNSVGFKNFNGNGFEAIAIQPDGKIIVAGRSSVYRLNNDGSLDTTFDADGFLSVSINGIAIYSKSLALQSDGKIIVAGFVSNGTNNDFALVRLNTDGSFDTSFDFDGKTTLAVGTGHDSAFAVAIQSNGKIVMSGQAHNGTDYDFATVRFNSIGTLDTSFGTNGIAITSLSSSNDLARSIDIQSDGKILVAGSASGKFAIARYNSNGTLDTTFDTDGLVLSNVSLAVTTSLYPLQMHKPNIKCLSSGKILVSGTSTGNFALLQFNGNGSIDSSFGTNGHTVYNVDEDASGFLLIKADGKIISGGTTSSTIASPRIVQSQFSSNGVFESATIFNSKAGIDEIIATIEQSNGKTVVLGNTKINQSGFSNIFVRYNSNGSIDTTFGINGVMDIGSMGAYRMTQQQDGKILISSLYMAAIYRYTADGVLDTTFGTDGAIDLGAATNNMVNFIDAIVTTPDGKIYVAFDYDDSANNGGTLRLNFGLLRLNNDGNFDTSFGINGLANTRFDFYGTDQTEYPSDILIQSDGKIVLTGPLSIYYAGSTDFTTGIVRFNTDGTVDTTFGTDGKVTTQIGTFNYPYGLKGMTNNKFVINSRDASNSYFTTQYNSDGSLDTAFGTNGTVSDQAGYVYSKMIIQPDGKILKGGYYNNQFAMSRYNSNGGLDTSFGINGTLSTSIYYSSRINDLLVLQSGKLLVSGNSFNGSNDVFAQARYTGLTLGTLDFTEKGNSFFVYPNPIQQEATFEYTLKNDENVSIDIIDLQGKIVQSVLKNKEQSSGDYKQNINLSNNLSAGNYILRFSSPSGNQSIKIIKKD
jgi:uncharacterized delta-60 repeat protein